MITRKPVRLPTLGAAALTLWALIATSVTPVAGTVPSSPGATSLGPMRWSFLTRGPVRSTPVLSGRSVLVTSTDGSMYSLDVDSGREIWRYDAGTPIASTPVVNGSRAYLVDRANRVHAVDVGTGEPVWTRDTGPDMPLAWGLEGWDYVTASPVLVGEALYVGSGDGAIYALSATDGELRWRVQTAGRIRATPTLAGDTLYVGDSDGVFHALDSATGETRWRFETDGHTLDSAAAGYDRRQVVAPAAVHDGTVYVGGRDAQVYALDAATGALEWQTDDGTSAWVIAAPVVHRGRLLVTRSSSTRVRALALDSGREIWSQQAGSLVFAPAVPMQRGVLVATGRGSLIGYSEEGHEQWRYNVGGGVWSPPTLTDSMLYVGSDDGIVRAFPLSDRAMPTLHVFTDESVAKSSGLGSRPAHAGIANYFGARGYRLLDAASLPEFMDARASDGAQSVIVFAVDGAYDALAEGSPEPLLRRYLAAGGRVIWLGYAPGLMVTDAEGQITGQDRGRPTELLGVDHAPYNFDDYGVWPTAEGRRWGLSSRWIDGPRVEPAEDIEVLARNEVGGVVAWAREVGTAGGVFVHLYATTDRSRLDEIRAVAEYGIYRSPAARHHEASSPE